MHPGALTVQIVAWASGEAMAQGVEIAAVGMLMVFAALALLTVFLTLLPRALTRLQAVWPETAEHHAAADVAAQLDDDDDVLAGIGFVMHAELQGQR